MNEITKVFNNPEFGEIRTVVKDNEIYFVGKDIAESLGYKDSVNALKAHVDIEDKLTWQLATSGQNRNMTIITESGVYALVFGSKLPQAKQFKRWVTSDVLLWRFLKPYLKPLELMLTRWNRTMLPKLLSLNRSNK